MAEDKKTYRIFLSAAEHSADSHCAGLITALKQTPYNFEFVGVGGEKMTQAGCELLEKTTNKSAMIHKAFGQVIRFIRLLSHIKSYFKKNKVDLVIVCDSPAFNFHVAKIAKKAGARTLFYVAPQLWAWAPWRMKKLKNCCDKMCCILPFEQNWFTERGLETNFVGNPLFDDLDFSLDRCVKTYENFNPRNAHIAIMPGSRQAEIATLWKPMQKIAVDLKRKYPHITFTAVAADENIKIILQATPILGFRCQYEIGSVVETAKKADFALVASGSATLQVASAGCPMVIMYQSNKYLWHLVGRWLVKTKYLSLVNILSQKELLPEFMPYFDSTGPIYSAVDNLLMDKNSLAKLSRDLIETVKPLTIKNAGKEVAKTVIEMLN